MRAAFYRVRVCRAYEDTEEFIYPYLKEAKDKYREWDKGSNPNVQVYLHKAYRKGREFCYELVESTEGT